MSRKFGSAARIATLPSEVIEAAEKVCEISEQIIFECRDADPNGFGYQRGYYDPHITFYYYSREGRLSVYVDTDLVFEAELSNKSESFHLKCFHQGDWENSLPDALECAKYMHKERDAKVKEEIMKAFTPYVPSIPTETTQIAEPAPELTKLWDRITKMFWWKHK